MPLASQGAQLPLLVILKAFGVQEEEILQPLTLVSLVVCLWPCGTRQIAWTYM